MGKAPLSSLPLRYTVRHPIQNECRQLPMTCINDAGCASMQMLHSGCWAMAVLASSGLLPARNTCQPASQLHSLDAASNSNGIIGSCNEGYALGVLISLKYCNHVHVMMHQHGGLIASPL